MSEHHHRRTKIHTKHIFIAAVTAIVVMMALALFSDSDFNLPMAPTATQPIQINADLNNLPELQFNRNFETIEFTLANSESIVNIGDGVLDTEGEAKITLQDYTGKIALTSEFLTLDGKANKILVNGVGIKKGALSIKTSTENARFKELTIPGLDISSLSYKASGDLVVDNGKGSFNIDDEVVSMKRFRGDLDIEDNVKFSGTVSEISISDITIQK